MNRVNLARLLTELVPVLVILVLLVFTEQRLGYHIASNAPKADTAITVKQLANPARLAASAAAVVRLHVSLAVQAASAVQQAQLLAPPAEQALSQIILRAPLAAYVGAALSQRTAVPLFASSVLEVVTMPV